MGPHSGELSGSTTLSYSVLTLSDTSIPSLSSETNPLCPLYDEVLTLITSRSIHRKRMPVTEVKSGQTASFSLKKIKRSQIRKGMVMVSPALEPQCSYEFEGEILVLHHPTTISCKYQAMVHCGSIRQTASIIRMSSECLRTGDKAQVLFR